MFNIGQLVECINDDWGRDPRPHPVKGGKYTIIRVEPPGMFATHKIPHLGFNGFGPAYASNHFRPITEKKTDISIFIEILKTGKIKRTKKVKEPV